MRLGAVPDTDVKTPQLPPGKAEHPLFASVRWSSQYREDGVVVTGPRQRTDVSKGRIGSRKLRIAVGRDVDAVKGLVVQGVRERQRNVGYLIVPVIAAIGRPWHDVAAYLFKHVLADAKRSDSIKRWRSGCIATLPLWIIIF